MRIVRLLKSRVATQPQLHPALLRLSAMISQYFILCRAWLLSVETAWLSFIAFSARARRRVFGSADHSEVDQTWDRAGAARESAVYLQLARLPPVLRLVSVKR